MSDAPHPDPNQTPWALALSFNATTDRLDSIVQALRDIHGELARWREERQASASRDTWVKDVDGIHPLRPERDPVILTVAELTTIILKACRALNRPLYDEITEAELRLESEA